MGRSQRHRVEGQGYAARGNVFEEGAINDQICAQLTNNGTAPLFPTLTSLNPATAVMGGADLTMHCIGTGFTPDCKILFNGGEEVTTFVSATDISTVVKPSLVTIAGQYPVQVKKFGYVTPNLMFTFTATELLAASQERELPLGPIPIQHVEDHEDGIQLVLAEFVEVRVGDTVLIEATGNSSINGSCEVLSVDGNTIVVANDYELASPIEAKGRVTVTSEA